MRILLCLLTIYVLAEFCPTADAAQKPNILFIFADDLCFETIQAFGHTDIETPNLDKLVKRGTTFTHAYNMGSWSGAVCVASRTMLVTGRSVWRAEAIYNKTNKELEQQRLWPQLMAKAGYQTYFTGKWHVQANAERAFETARHIRAGMPKDTPQGYNRPLPNVPDPWSPSDPEFGGFWEGGKHWSEVVADDTIDFLSAAKTTDKPFFMYVAFNAAHDPRQSPQEYIDKYPLARIKVPENFQEEYPYKDDIGCSKTLRDEKLAPFPRTPHAIQVHRKEYYALITHMDHEIGRIFEQLQKTGQSENTYIIFTADHGLAIGHHGLLGKQNMYEHSLRVPFIIAGPDIPQNKKIDAPIYLQDAMATSLEIADIKQPDYVEFQSVLPLIKGDKSATPRDIIYGAYLELQRAIIHDGWKLIVYPKAKVSRLYHLANDPQEQHDLADDIKYQDVKKSLLTRLKKEQQLLEDKLILE